ncbi:hypothetical protein COO60DRAFT_894666 [Scenedesmus sp. NREL 46B-D3]|nr:hypothetical protein COO60DRAFT_894666 [Scenedesmus sp. NREL 46B-D3]
MAAQPADNHSRLLFDVLSACLLLLTALLGAYLPRYLAARGGQRAGTATSLAFHLGNMLSGGVMLSAGFCHLLADSLRQLAFIGRFPIATFLAAVGYLITLLADQMVQGLTAQPSQPAAASHGRGSGVSAGQQPHGYMQLDKQDAADNAIEMAAAVPGTGFAAPGPGGALQSIQQQDRCDATPVSSRVRSSTAAAAAAAGRPLLHASIPAGNSSSAAFPAIAERIAAGAASTSALPTTAAAAGDDLALCVSASSSPRAITAGSVFSRSAATSRAGAAAAVTAARASGGGAACGWLATDDLSISHPSTPDPLQQQQQQQEEEDMLVFGHSTLGGQKEQQQLLLGTQHVDSYASGLQGTAEATAAPARKLPCSKLLASMSPKTTVQHSSSSGIQVNSSSSRMVQVRCPPG